MVANGSTNGQNAGPPFSKAVRLAIVESQTLLREGIMSLCENIAEFEIVASVARVAELCTGYRYEAIDVILLDLAAESASGLGTIPQLQSVFPAARIIVFDDAPRLFRLAQLSKYSTSGYCTKSDSFAELLETIRAVSRGEIRFSPLADSWIEHTPQGWHVRGNHRSQNILLLTDRELEVLRCFAEGQSVKLCAQQLGISPSTAENHRARIFKKLGVSKTVDMIRLAISEGVVDG